MKPPKVERHEGIFVARDDLLAGGTKRRYMDALYMRANEVVYATPACGGAQVALAYAARAAGKRATLFVAKRATPHARTLEARAAGARVFQVGPGGYLSVVQARARRYAADAGALYAEFGGESAEANAIIAEAAAAVWRLHGPFDEVWCAAGSGVLLRGLQAGMTAAPRFVAVQVGRALEDKARGRADVVVAPYRFEQECREAAPFPACPNYDRKAFVLCRAAAARAPGLRRLFWNVMGPSPTAHGEA